MFFVMILLCVVLFLIWRRKNGRKSHTYVKQANKRDVYINKHYKFNDEDFLIQGTKDYFKIQKNNDLIFTIADGQIVSITEKNKKYTYGVE